MELELEHFNTPKRVKSKWAWNLLYLFLVGYLFAVERFFLERYVWQVDYKLLREESKFSHGLGESQRTICLPESGILKSWNSYHGKSVALWFGGPL